MDLRIFTGPQLGATYDQLLASALLTEELGFDAWFRSDHLSRIGPGPLGPGPTDSWITLGALARETERIRLGTLVTSGTFRLPGPLAVSVSQVDAMSDGRVELGLGTGWYDDEHQQHGIPFPPLKERFQRLEEQLQILHGLWSDDRWRGAGGPLHHLLEGHPLELRVDQQQLRLGLVVPQVATQRGEGRARKVGPIIFGLEHLRDRGVDQGDSHLGGTPRRPQRGQLWRLGGPRFSYVRA
jgi:alkanesulfonate monooxygenase SsuD/methylene tetrahydromethanopterin reductase-like flavin-dependent oxidoreductase (luciferase family)